MNEATFITEVVHLNRGNEIHTYPEEDPFYRMIFRNHAEVESYVAFLRNKASKAWGTSSSPH
jgi:hypothetical protein